MQARGTATIDPVPDAVEKDALAAKLVIWSALVAAAAQLTLHVFPAWRSAGETTSWLHIRFHSGMASRLILATVVEPRAL